MLRALAAVCVLAAASRAADPDFAPVGKAVAASIAKGDCPGAVVVIVHADKVVHSQAFGDRSTAPARVAMTADTVFDLASLTKPVATAACVMKLVEQGKLSPADPVAKHWPAFAANGKAGVTVEHCLLHTSGLIADNALADYAGGKDAALAKVAALPLTAPPGTKFTYSDVGFITLGAVVARAGGVPLDEFARRELFAPLKMADTTFTPGDTLKERTAPTSTRDKQPIVGTVHDPRAFALGGVAGHAGLFGTAADLARFARMLLNNGELDGVRVFKPETVRLYTEPVAVPGKSQFRSRGWDVATGFSAPRGTVWPAGQGFGHTGFTGTSVWVDPPSKTAVILLTSRLHPDEKGNVAALRREVGTLVAKAVAAAAPPVKDIVIAPPAAGSVEVTPLDKEGVRMHDKPSPKGIDAIVAKLGLLRHPGTPAPSPASMSSAATTSRN